MNYPPDRLQLNLFEDCDLPPEPLIPQKSLLGVQVDHACGWIETHKVKRYQKKSVWEGEQSWLHWQEIGGKKRSRYIPKSKLKAVQASVYELRNPIDQTLQLLEKKG